MTRLKAGGGGGDPSTLDADNPFLTGAGTNDNSVGSCPGSSMADVTAVQAATQKLSGLKAEYEALPKTNTLAVQMKRQEVGRLEAELAKMTPGTTEAMGGASDPYRSKQDEIHREKQKLNILETQHQQRNAKLAEIQAATKALENLCPSS